MKAFAILDLQFCASGTFFGDRRPLVQRSAPRRLDHINNSNAYTTTPVIALQTSEPVLHATKITNNEATRTAAAGQIPASNIAGSNISFATSAAKAAGGIRFSARLASSGSLRPFSKKKGSTLQASIVIAHVTNINQNSSQLTACPPSR